MIDMPCGLEAITHGTGTVVGIASALASTRFLEALVYDVNMVDPVVFVAMSAMMMGIGMLARYVPVRRASNVDAIESLRNDSHGASGGSSAIGPAPG